MTNTYIKPFVCILLSLLLLTSCAPVQKTVELKTTPVPTAVEVIDQPTLNPTDAVEELPAHTPEPTASQKPFGPSKIEHNLTETRTHILHRKPYQTEDGDEYVTEIDVLEDGDVLQTLTIKEAIEKALEGLPQQTEIEMIEDEWFRNWDRTHWFFMCHDDINFDGYNDFAIMLNGGGTAETWLYWIWNEAADEYQPCRILSGQYITLDAERKTITTRTHSGSGTYSSYEYAWLNEKKPICVYHLIEEHNRDYGQMYFHHYERVNDELKEVRCVVSEKEPDRLSSNGSSPGAKEVTVKMRGGQTRTLRLYGYSGFRDIDIMDENRNLIEQRECDIDYFYTSDDYNGDGSEDLCTVETSLISCGGSCAEHWLIWNPEKGEFVRGEKDPTVTHSYG